jgi:hypothetical protein
MSLPSEQAEGRDYEGERLYDHRFGDPCQDPGVEIERVPDCVEKFNAEAVDDNAEEPEPETFVGHSVERGGWCVYVQSAPGEYDVLRGPFGSQEEADASLARLVDRSKTPNAAAHREFVEADGCDFETVSGCGTKEVRSSPAISVTAGETAHSPHNAEASGREANRPFAVPDCCREVYHG